MSRSKSITFAICVLAASLWGHLLVLTMHTRRIAAALDRAYPAQEETK